MGFTTKLLELALTHVLDGGFVYQYWGWSLAEHVKNEAESLDGEGE